MQDSSDVIIRPAESKQQTASDVKGFCMIIVTVTTCWQPDLHVLTDDRPASSNPSLQGGCSAHARLRWVFLTTEHCKLDADYIKQ